MNNQQAISVLRRDYDILCRKLKTILNYSFNLKYVNEHDGNKKMFLDSPQGLLLKEGIVHAVIIKETKASMPVEKKSLPEYESTLVFHSIAQAKDMIKLIEVIADFVKEEFSVNISVEHPNAGYKIVLTFY